MRYRLATLWPRANYAADKTEIIDIDLIDPISRLVVVYEPDANPGGAGAEGHPAKCISRIEIVDGSDVLYSLTGQEAQAVDFYDRDKLPPNRMSYLVGHYSQMIYNLNFGRKLFDPELAFDPGKFRNPQLKVTIDINGGGYLSNDGYLTVIAHIFDEKTVSPFGFLMSKEVKDYSLGSASHEYTDLPLDFPYKQLFLRGQKYGTRPDALFDTVKISQDVDRKIPLNHSMSEIIRNMLDEWSECEEGMLVPTETTTGTNLFCIPTHRPRFSHSQWRAAAQANCMAQFIGDGGRFTHSGEAVNCNVSVIVRGYAPHAVIPLLPRLEPEDKDGYDVSGIKSLKLDVLTLAAAAVTDSAQIISQQIRRY